MSYNRLNKLLRDKKVIEIVKEHYKGSYCTYKGIWKNHVCPVYPMDYKTFLSIINAPNPDSQIAKLQSKTTE